MIGKKALGVAAGLTWLFIIAAPLMAADKTVQLKIPGCAA